VTGVEINNLLIIWQTKIRRWY